jgi:antitoxin (DNA-binding transcriptional repressor) of toxin-antitoxin stability system
MKSVSMLEFRKDAERVLQQVIKGRSFVLTYRGKAVARLEPLGRQSIDPDDPIYRLTEIAESGGALTNEEIDKIVYGG